MPRVVVLGSSGFDLTVRMPRLPRPGETLLGGELHRGPGGKGANAAIAARRAGAEVTFLTAFGDDEFGREIRDHDRREGLDLSHALVVPGVSNQVALILVGEDGQNIIGVAPGASLAMTGGEVASLPDEVFDRQAVFLASLEVPLEAVALGLARAKGRGMTTILNPAPADRALIESAALAHVDVLTPNQEEAHVLTGIATGDLAGAEAAGRRLLEAGAKRVVVTLGEAGCLVVTNDQMHRVPGFAVVTVDTVGAGDAFNGALATAMAEGRDLMDAAFFANAAGALAVTRPGAQGALPVRGAIEDLIRSSGR